MFRELFLFEIKYRLKRISTYVYFAIWFFMAFFTVSARNFGPGGGKVLKNGPYLDTLMAVQFSAFGIVIVSAIFGTSILRDFQENTYSFFFTTPIKKLAYLGGRWLGSFVICVLVFSGLIWGALIGYYMPWADRDLLMPPNLWFHVQPFLLFAVTTIFFAGSLFFMVGAFTRKQMVVYLQGIILFAIYLIGVVYVANNQDNLNPFWPSVLDPLGVSALQTATRYWTVVEKNSQLLSFSGVIAYNRLLWCGVGVLSLLVTLRFFPFSAEALTMRKAKKIVADDDDLVVAPARTTFRTARQRFTASTTWAQFISLTKARLNNVVRELPFVALVLIAIVLFVLNGKDAGRFFDVPVYPVTYLMILMVRNSYLFFIIIATLYAGELIWKERDIKFAQINDALPAPTWLTFASQLTALGLIQFVLLLVLIAIGVFLQAVQGYYRFELDVYVKEILVIDFINLLCIAAWCLFMHNIIPNKYAAHTVIVGTFILTSILFNFGFQNPLYQIWTLPTYTYSDMNGFGHFVKPILWFTLYWLALAGVMAMVAIVLTRRSEDLTWRARLSLAKQSFRFPINALTALFLLAFIAIGAYIYYNTHIVNKYRDRETGLALQARYEKEYKKFEGLPQPKITDVQLTVDIFPERRAFASTGTFTLVNKTDQAIQDLHILDANQSLQTLRFDRSFKETLADNEIGYHIYQLAEPLKPNEAMKMDFTVGWEAKGFASSDTKPEFAYNGTFFDRGYFPVLGYNEAGEISDENDRKDQKLPPQAEMPEPGDPKYIRRNLFSEDADWIHFKATVSTAPDQIAIAPGYLQKEWTENGRRYFSYDMGDTKIQNFYSFVSGRYAVKRDQWNDVKIEVYYDPAHEYNVARMIDSTKKGLEYFTNNFGPYQFNQFRILEFPRYRSFAQSFPNTVPYSEGIGFIAHGTKEDDLDIPFYVTGHELAHQWWGHQVIGHYARGSNMLSESLAQYAALMVMEKEVGASNIRNYLKHELNRYLSRRGNERRKEEPMATVQRESYAWYEKGSLVFYALKDYLGEERLNAALKQYVSKVKFQEPPYTHTTEFLNALREATPEEMKYLITDLFETITLFDNKTVEATYRETPDKKYVVKIKINARKLRADGLGKESEIALNDLVDIGIFTGEKKTEKALFLEKRKITQPAMEFEITVAQPPTRAGIDPYNKLIDRTPDDNAIVATKAP
jgi:ABC-2 type transport system permease protein